MWRRVGVARVAAEEDRRWCTEVACGDFDAARLSARGLCSDPVASRCLTAARLMVWRQRQRLPNLSSMLARAQQENDLGAPLRHRPRRWRYGPDQPVAPGNYRRATAGLCRGPAASRIIPRACTRAGATTVTPEGSDVVNVDVPTRGESGAPDFRAGPEAVNNGAAQQRRATNTASACCPGATARLGREPRAWQTVSSVRTAIARSPSVTQLGGDRWRRR